MKLLDGRIPSQEFPWSFGIILMAKVKIAKGKINFTYCLSLAGNLRTEDLRRVG
jgi:hypothetical protein